MDFVKHDTIRVAIRVRPMLSQDFMEDERDLVDHCEDGTSLVVQPPPPEEDFEEYDDFAPKALFGAGTPGRPKTPGRGPSTPQRGSFHSRSQLQRTPSYGKMRPPKTPVRGTSTPYGNKTPRTKARTPWKTPVSRLVCTV